MLMKWLLALLLSVMSGAALAETTGAVNPGSVPAQPSANDDVPPGGCMPIGMTTAGEIVFPIQCKEFIERHRGAETRRRAGKARRCRRETRCCGGKARGRKGEARHRGTEARGCRGEVRRK